MANDTIRKRNNRNRRAGYKWEHDIETHTREQGFRSDRTRNSGIHDQGDLAVETQYATVVVEAKNASEFTPGPFLDEAHIELENYMKPRPYVNKGFAMVFAKRRGKGQVKDGFALMSIETALELLSGYRSET